MKKRLLTFLMTSGLLAVIGCICKDIPDFWRIDGIRQVVLSGKAGEIVENGVITTDTLVLTILDSVTFHTSSFGPLSLTATLSALSCQDPGSRGTKDTITSFDITSSADFNLIKAGASLIPLLKPRYSNLRTVPEQIHKLNINEDNYTYFWNNFDYEVLEKPSQAVPRTFKVKMSFQSGRSLEAESAATTWK